MVINRVVKMYPSRHTLEYMNEMDKLFSRNHDFDLHSPMLSSSSHSFQSIVPSSSSTETSPESYPDITVQRQFQNDGIFDLRQDTRSDLFDRSGSDIFDPRANTFDQRASTFDPRSDTFDPRTTTFEKRPDIHDSREYHRFIRADTPFERSEVYDRQTDRYQRSPDTFNRSETFKRQDTPFKRELTPFERTETPFERTNSFERMSNERDVFETPLIIRRQRPIIGRKIMASTELPKIHESNMIWAPIELPQTPPKSNVYELFPMENRGFEMTPVKSSSYSSSPMTLSPMQASPNLQSSPKPIAPRMLRTPPRQFIPSRPFRPHESTQNYPGTSQDYQQKQCSFCKKNGETPLVYMAHSVKEKVGGRNIVTCPILRRHVCTICGASGDNAHTITYCPILRNSNNGQPLRSTTITLKNTRVKSNGRRRY